ncbi:MAG: dihydroorotase [Devosiaceae bacterium]|nr:dihydroorotase [Devosiaceae bacterium MH13]
MAVQPVKITNVRVIDPSRNLDAPGAILMIDGRIIAAGPDAAATGVPDGCLVLDGRGAVAAPGLVDMQVRAGEPGAEHLETLETASKAAATGGVTSLGLMPDTDPVIDDAALVDFLMRRARDTAVVHIHPIAALTKGLDGVEMAEIGLLREAGAVAFSNGRHPVANSAIFRHALTYARDFGGLVIHHPEDADLRGNGVMHEGERATRYGLPGIPEEAELVMLDRDVRLARLTGGRYHAAQISCARSVETVRRAKAEGIKLTVGVSANHLSLNELDIGMWRTFLKLSPPLRTEDDREALIEGVKDGTIDVIVSDHDPQDVERKRHPFAEAHDGAVGLETLLPAALRLVHNEQISLPTLIDKVATTPAAILGIDAGTLAPGAPGDVVVFDPDEPWVLDRKALVSRSKNTAFEDARFSGRVKATFVNGRLVAQAGADGRPEIVLA